MCLHIKRAENAWYMRLLRAVGVFVGGDGGCGGRVSGSGTV